MLAAAPARSRHEHLFLTSGTGRYLPDARGTVPRSRGRSRSRLDGADMELTVLGCSGSYGAPGGGACSGYLLRVAATRRSGSTAATARSATCRSTSRSRTSPRSCSPTATPTTASTSTGCTCSCATASGARTSPCSRPRASRSSCCRSCSDWGNTFDWRAVGDGDTDDGRRHRRCSSRAPTTRRPRTRSRRARDGRRLIYTADTGPGLDASARSRPAPTSCCRRPRTSHANIPAPIHLSAKQAGEAAREARRAAPDPHPPLAA